MIQKYLAEVQEHKDSGKNNFRYLVIQNEQQLKSIQFAEELQIIELYIDNCSCVQIDPAPKNITDLTLYRCKLNKLNGIQHMIQLTQLYLNNNNIQDISQIKSLINLKELFLSENKIVNIHSLQSLKKLKTLSINCNSINDIQYIKRLTNLTQLDVSNNLISDITPITKLTGLLVLGISQNNIVNIKALEQLTYLEEADLFGNYIQNFQPISNHMNRNRYIIEKIGETKGVQEIPSKEQINYSFKRKILFDFSNIFDQMKQTKNKYILSSQKLQNVDKLLQKVKYSQILIVSNIIKYIQEANK
ncbi:Conserved_hypothetical protein [Hexamita inflata]|uniref:Leucine-rich repeat protein n=1 Tax=Hexamita inflata TaxID=28002 RepID=A0AA86U5N3_9EUKA|nr:Conserved hypothetical protein [Hexamita inflata]